MGCSFGDLRLLLLEQGRLVDEDRGGLGATLGGIMLRLGSTFRAAISINHVDHGGLHGLVPIEVGLPHAMDRIKFAEVMSTIKARETVASYQMWGRTESRRNFVKQFAGDRRPFGSMLGIF
jgi:hypothetical protein